MNPLAWEGYLWRLKPTIHPRGAEFDIHLSGLCVAHVSVWCQLNPVSLVNGKSHAKLYFNPRLRVLIVSVIHEDTLNLSHAFLREREPI